MFSVHSKPSFLASFKLTMKFWAKFVVEIDVTLFLSGKVSVWLLFGDGADYVTCTFELWLRLVYCCKVMWLGPLFRYAKTSYIVKCIFMWAIHFHSQRFFRRLPFSLFSISFSLYLSLSSLSFVRLLKLFCFVVYTVYLYCWVGRTHLVYEKYSPLSHIRIGLLINNVDGTCTPVEVFGFLSSNNISLFHFLGLPHACGPVFFSLQFLSIF